MEDKIHYDFDAMYKCRLCGQMFVNTIIMDDKERIERNLTEFRMLGDCTDSLSGKYVLHCCNDNSLGIADFCGYKVRGRKENI